MKWLEAQANLQQLSHCGKSHGLCILMNSSGQDVTPFELGMKKLPWPQWLIFLAVLGGGSTLAVELFSFAWWGDIKVTWPADGSQIGLPSGVRTFEHCLLPKQVQWKKVTNVIISNTCAPSPAPDLWLEQSPASGWWHIITTMLLSGGKTHALGPAIIPLGASSHIWLHSMHAEDDLFLQMFMLNHGNLQVKWLWGHTWRPSSCKSSSNNRKWTPEIVATINNTEQFYDKM